MELKQDVSIIKSFFYWTMPFFRLVTCVFGLISIILISFLEVIFGEITQTGAIAFAIIVYASYVISMCLSLVGEALRKREKFFAYWVMGKTKGKNFLNIISFILQIVIFTWLYYFGMRYAMLQAGYLSQSVSDLSRGEFFGHWAAYALILVISFIFIVFTWTTACRDMGEVVLREEFGINDQVVVYQSGHHYEADFVVDDTLYIKKVNDYDEYGGKKAYWLGFFLPFIGFPCWVVVTIIRIVRNCKQKNNN